MVIVFLWLTNVRKSCSLPDPTQMNSLSMWENNQQLNHPMSFKCKASHKAMPRLVRVEDHKLPIDCPYNTESGELNLPSSIEQDDEKRIQANHCYRDWMHQQRRNKFFKKQKEKRTKKNKLLNLLSLSSLKQNKNK